MAPPSDDGEGPEDQVSDSDDDDADDDDLDEEFLAMVDSERQTELRLQKLRKKAEKRRKLQAEKKIGRHTTFVSDDGDGALIGENAIGQSIEADHGIDVVVLPTVKRSGGGASDDDSDESGSEDEGYGRVDVSVVLGTKPSKAAMLFSRGQVECGDVSRKGNKRFAGPRRAATKVPEEARIRVGPEVEKRPPIFQLRGDVLVDRQPISLSRRERIWHETMTEYVESVSPLLSVFDYICVLVYMLGSVWLGNGLVFHYPIPISNIISVITVSLASGIQSNS